MPSKGEGRVCQREGCERPLTGKQEKWCCETCKVEAWYQSKVSGKTAEEMLSALPQKELRAVIRRVMERRWPGKRGRWRTRFGAPWMPPGGPGPRS